MVAAGAVVVLLRGCGLNGSWYDVGSSLVRACVCTFGAGWIAVGSSLVRACVCSFGAGWESLGRSVGWGRCRCRIDVAGLWSFVGSSPFLSSWVGVGVVGRDLCRFAVVGLDSHRRDAGEAVGLVWIPLRGLLQVGC